MWILHICRVVTLTFIEWSQDDICILNKIRFILDLNNIKTLARSNVVNLISVSQIDTHWNDPETTTIIMTNMYSDKGQFKCVYRNTLHIGGLKYDLCGVYLIDTHNNLISINIL